ncbi:mitochondrial carrier [Lasallia pustulata]|uniref:Mitochondrial carrier n=1 Tax=Lasallia pustulata TaxID=136370 RepID=A0A1W5CTX1_9LECA|nr:mitochondrial carrier [Lasallia pustulata]
MVTASDQTSRKTDVSIPTKQNGPDAERKDARGNAATGASAAGVRAVSARLLTFYFRAPAKAFFRTRVDYLAFVRAINPRAQAKESWSWRMSTPGLLAHAVRKYGWGFIPNQILPPMLANTGVGAILYTSYLQILGVLHEPSSQSTKRVYPPPPVYSTYTAGFSAGAIQSVVAAPLDALQMRFSTSDILEGHHKNMWQWGRHKLSEIGMRGIFSGWGLSFLKDSFGYGAFFATFEYLKAQSYYAFVTRYYGFLSLNTRHSYRRGPDSDEGVLIIRPHFTLEPAFLMLAGVRASIMQQTVQHPLNLIQSLHYGRLESLDHQAKLQPSGRQMLDNYYRAYEKTFEQCQIQAKGSGGWRKWLYRGFFINSLKQVPSTSAGLVIFELVRRRYGNDAEAVRIQKDGYDILLA